MVVFARMYVAAWMLRLRSGTSPDVLTYTEWVAVYMQYLATAIRYEGPRIEMCFSFFFQH